MKEKKESVRRTLRELTDQVFRQAGLEAPSAAPTKNQAALRKERRRAKRQKRHLSVSEEKDVPKKKKAKIAGKGGETGDPHNQELVDDIKPKKKKVKQVAEECQAADPDPFDEELAYLEGKLGLTDGAMDDKFLNQMDAIGFDAEFMSFVDDIVSKKKKSKKAAKGGETGDPRNQELIDDIKPKKKKVKQVAEECQAADPDPLDEELAYLERKLGLTDGAMDAKFLKQMDAIGLDEDFLSFVDDIVPKKKKDNETSGRTKKKKDKAAAPVVKDASDEPVGKYLPPHLRKAREEQSVETKLNGLFNKLTEGNLDVTAKDIARVAEDLRRERPADSHGVFARLFVEAAVSNPTMNVLVIACYAAVVCTTAVAVHISIASAVLAELACRLRRYVETKEDVGVTKNVVIFTSILFYFGLLPSSVPFGLFKALFADTPTDGCIDLALTILRYCGRTLRSQFTEDLKEIFIFLTSKTAKHKNKDEGRVKWLLMDLDELKNNKNVSFTVMDRFDQTKSWLESCGLMRGKRVKEFMFDLPFEFPDEPAENWVADPLNTGHMVKLAARGREKSSPLWDEARSQGMNTDLRKSAYVALMGAEDDAHAVIRLSEICKGPKQIGDVCVVVLHCAVRAQANNPFFSLVMIGMCDKPGTWGKKFAHGFKQALTTHLTQVHTYNTPSALNTADFFAAGIASDAVNLPFAHIRFLKFDQVAGANASPFSGVLGLFIRRTVERLFLLCEDLDRIFSSLRQYEDVREGVLTAIENLVAPRMKTAEDKEKLDIARKALERGETAD